MSFPLHGDNNTVTAITEKYLGLETYKKRLRDGGKKLPAARPPGTQGAIRVGAGRRRRARTKIEADCGSQRLSVWLSVSQSCTPMSQSAKCPFALMARMGAWSVTELRQGM